MAVDEELVCSSYGDVKMIVLSSCLCQSDGC